MLEAMDRLIRYVDRRSGTYKLETEVFEFFGRNDAALLQVDYQVKFTCPVTMNRLEDPFGTPLRFCENHKVVRIYANVFLHYVFGLWINDWRKREAQGKVTEIRYADDFVIGFREESDARRCLAALTERFAKFGLELHPDKTRLIEFGRYAEERRAKRGDSPPETFDFLGFTHISGKTRRGDFTIHRKTSRKKFQTKLDALRVELLRRRHADLAETGGWLLRLPRTVPLDPSQT